jgi:hypothetical protein
VLIPTFGRIYELASALPEQLCLLHLLPCSGNQSDRENVVAAAPERPRWLSLYRSSGNSSLQTYRFAESKVIRIATKEHGSYALLSYRRTDVVDEESASLGGAAVPQTRDTAGVPEPEVWSGRCDLVTKGAKIPKPGRFTTSEYVYFSNLRGTGSISITLFAFKP